MRIIHTADLHLDSSLTANLNSIKAKERKRELLFTFEALINYAKNNNVDAILIAGDMFDKSRVSVKTKSYIMDLIESNRMIDFIYLSGNHDEDAFIKGIDIKPDNLYIFDDKWQTISYENVDITGVTLNDSNKEVIYDTLALNRNKLNIVTLHGPISTNKKKGISINDLKNKYIDYLALGHIHSYQKETLDDRGIYVYSGCLEGRGFDEIGQKGFVILNITDKIESEFIPFAKRILHEVVVDITGIDAWSDIKKAIEENLINIEKSDMVLVRLIGVYDLDLIKHTDILEASLNDEYYFASVSDDSRLKINPKEYEKDISLKGEFIRNVLASDIDEDLKNQVIEYGIKALLKEEL